jgi:ubiquitin-like protein Pup
VADQTRKPRPKKEEEQPEAQAQATTETDEESKDLDELLDEIDEVLEEQAEDFVRSFVQKGGELVVPASLFGAPDLPLWAAILVVAVLYVLWYRDRRIHI